MQKKRSETQVRRALQPDRHEEFVCDPSGDLSDGFLVLLVAGSFALLLFLLLLETLAADRFWLYKARPGIVVLARAMHWLDIMLLSVRAIVGDLPHPHSEIHTPGADLVPSLYFTHLVLFLSTDNL